MAILIIIFSISIFLQFTAVYLSFRLIRTTGWQLAWSIVAMALLFMGIRRTISFIQILNAHTLPASYIPELVALGISLLMVIGVYLIGPAFVAGQKATQAIQQSEQRFRGLFEASETPIINFDFSRVYLALQELHNQNIADIQKYFSQEQGLVLKFIDKVSVIQANPASVKLFGTDLGKSYYGNGIQAIIVPKTIDAFIRVLTAIWNQEARCRSEIELRSVRGKLLHCVFSMPIPSTESGYRSIPVSILDISDLKQAEADLKKQQEVNYRIQKMEALGNLSGGIAHDFNNLLGIISGYAELLAGKLKDQPEISKYVDEIYSAAQRGSSLTKRLLAFSGRERESAKAVNIGAILLDNQDMLQKMLTARIQLTIQVDPNLWPIFVDPNEFEDAVLNMSINAKHAMEQGGELILSASNTNLSAKKASELKLDPGEYVQLCISDTGIGMNEDIQARLFEPFFTTKGQIGTGLGLSQVYGFVSHSGGTIKVQSVIDRGTQFYFYFPRDNHSEATKKSNEHNPAKKQGNETILVVDDEPALGNFIEEVLQSNGYTSIVVASGVKALEVLARQPIDLLLSDVIMPQMDGYQLAEIVREKYPNVCIQLMSGFSNEKNSSAANKYPYDCIAKPIDINQLLLKIRTQLDFAIAHGKAVEMSAN